MTRAELDHYARSQGVRLDLAAICNSTTEIDAAKEADAVMQQWVQDYYHVKDLAPHNPTRHKERFKTIFMAAKEEYEREMLLSEWRSLSPLRSQVKEAKSIALSQAIDLLLAANIGKKRIKMMIPILTDTLLDEDYLPTEIPTTPNFLK